MLFEDPPLMPDRDELEPLVRRCLGYAFALCHDRAAGEDLVQEAFVSTLRAGGPLSVPYLFAAIRSRFLDSRRRDALRVVEGQDALEDAAARAEPAQLLDVSELLVTREELTDALGRLRPVEREVLWLTAVEGCTASEVAQATGMPRGTVLSLVFRARERLRSELGSERSDGEGRRTLP